MVQLTLLWMNVGVILGALAQGARVGFSARGMSRANGWLASLAVGVAFALLGGWAGTLLFGRLYGTPTALWVGILGVVVAPWLWARLRRRNIATPAE
ncbi:MAG TPA: hypothetical protein VFN11_02610 [Ktedonobacterales bacterium]|nr:hypothetical protein [Ktedonobacterales bacterium]